VNVEFDLRIIPDKTISGGKWLRLFNILTAIKNLSVKIRFIYPIVIDYSNSSDTGSCQILENWAAKRPGADNNNG
jgi:hypothetical protein